MDVSALEPLCSHPHLAFLPAVSGVLPEAEWFVVGGAVRDTLLGRQPKELDLLVRNVTVERLLEVLGQFGRVAVVGRQFGVIVFMPEGGAQVDIALPRTESPGMSGAYRDVAVQTDPSLSIEEDLGRRDFTVNAMALRLADGALIDPHGGQADLLAKKLVAVGDPERRFAEDISRALRGLRFATQLGFDFDPATERALTAAAARCNEQREDGSWLVARETVAAEFLKSLAADASRALELWEKAGVLFLLMPELVPLANCVQPENMHSEGDVWTHSRLAVKSLSSDAFAAFFPGESVSVQTVLATLLHDVAKPETAAMKDGRMTFYGHPDKGAVHARAICERLRLSPAGLGVSADDVAWLVKMHLLPGSLRLDEVKRGTLVKHFLENKALGRELLHVAFADAAASLRPDGSVDHAPLRALMVALDELEAMRPNVEPLLTSRELMDEFDIAPGPQLGSYKNSLEEARLSKRIVTKDDARKFISSLLSSEPS